MSTVENLFHVCLQADHFDGMLNFYTGVMGFEQMFLLTVEDFRQILQMPAPQGRDGRPWLTYLRIAPQQYIEMFAGEINPPNFVKNPIVPYPDAPLSAICLATGDMEAALVHFNRAGVRLLRGPQPEAEEITAGNFPISTRGARLAYLRDPEANLLRLEETDAASGTRHIITGFAGLRLFANSPHRLAEFYHMLGLAEETASEGGTCRLSPAPGQYMEFTQIPKGAAHGGICQYSNSPMGHIALQVHSLRDAAYTWAKHGVEMYYNPTKPLKAMPLDPFQATFGGDGCLIGWIFDPEGNRLEIMEQPGDTLQQKWEALHPF